MKCVIIAAGDISDYGMVKQYIAPNDYIIAADGGYRHLVPLGVTCNHFLGDFDSLTEMPPEAGGAEVYPTEKDDTDTMLAIKHGLLQGLDSFVILGGLGGRLDHTIANIASLEYLKAHGAGGMLVDETTVVRMFGAGDTVLPITSGRYFSIFPFGCDSAVVSVSGVKYPLSAYRLRSDFPLGVSNVVTDRAHFGLTIHEGKILVAECRKN